MTREIPVPCLARILFAYRVLVYLSNLLVHKVRNSQTSSRLLHYPSFHPRTSLTVVEKEVCKVVVLPQNESVCIRQDLWFFILTSTLDSSGLLQYCL